MNLPILQQSEQMKTLIGNSLGKLTFINPLTNTIRYGSALLVSNNLLITPAQNIFDRQTKQYYEHFQFSFQQNSCSYKISHYFLLNDYIKAKSDKQSKLYDYGILQLQHPVYNNTSLCQTLKQIEKQKKQTFELQKYKANFQLLQKNLIIYKQKLKMMEEQCKRLKENSKQIKEENKDLLMQIHQFKKQLINVKYQQGQPSNSSLPFQLNQSIIQQANSTFSQLNNSNFSNLGMQLFSSKFDLPSPSIRQYYTIKEQRIICTQVNLNQYRMISVQPLPLQSKTQFKLIKSADKTSYFCLGIMSQKIKHLGGQKTSDETVEYWSYKLNQNGKFKMNGQQKLSNSKFYVKEGNTITICVDLQMLKIKFKNNRAGGLFDLDSKFKGKQMYIFLMIFNKGDQLQILS